LFSFLRMSLLERCTKQTLEKLQRVFISSARVIFGDVNRHHVTPCTTARSSALAAVKGTHLAQVSEWVSEYSVEFNAPCTRHNIGHFEGGAPRTKYAYWRTRQSTAWRHGIWMRCAFQFPLFPTFLLSVPLLVVIWSFPEQGYNSATGVLCGWFGRLEQSPTHHHHIRLLTFIYLTDRSGVRLVWSMTCFRFVRL